MVIYFKNKKFVSNLKKKEHYFILRHFIRFLKKKKCYDKFFENFTEQNPKTEIISFLETELGNSFFAEEIIATAFTWSQTTEGNSFWNKKDYYWGKEYKTLVLKMKSI